MRLYSLLAISLLAILTGCSTLTPTTVTPDRVQAVVKLGAYIYARAETDPARRVALAHARDGLQQLAEQQTWDIGAMVAIAQSNGLTFLTSDEGSLIVAGGLMFVDQVLNLKVDLRSQPYAKAVILGALDGLKLGMQGARGLGDEVLQRLRKEAESTRS